MAVNLQRSAEAVAVQAVSEHCPQLGPLGGKLTSVGYHRQHLATVDVGGNREHSRGADVAAALLPASALMLNIGWSSTLG